MEGALVKNPVLGFGPAALKARSTMPAPSVPRVTFLKKSRRLGFIEVVPTIAARRCSGQEKRRIAMVACKTALFPLQSAGDFAHMIGIPRFHTTPVLQAAEF